MHLQTYEVDITTASDGSATGYTPVVTGRVLSIRYVKPGSGGYSDGSTVTVTGETTGVSVWTESNVNASATRCPRQATHSTAGVASLYAAAGTAVNDYVFLAAERVKIVIASGGSAKTATYYVTIG